MEAIDEKLRRRQELAGRNGPSGPAEGVFQKLLAVLQILLLRGAGNPPHHLHHEPRMLADRRLAGEHAGVGAVEDRVGHVGRLSPRGSPGVLHAIEHLRGDDHRLLIPLAGADDLLLHHRHAGDVDLYAQVAAGHHHRIGRLHDRIEVIDRLPLLYLGDDAGLRAAGSQQFPEQLHLHGASHERQAHEVGAGGCGPFGMLPVGGAHRGHRQLHARQVDALAAADQAALHDAAAGFVGRTLLHHEADRAVGKHHRIAYGQFVDQPFVGGRELIRLPAFGAADEFEHRPLDALDGTAGDLA